MKRKIRVYMLIIGVILIGMNIFSISKDYANSDFEVYTRIAKPIIFLKKDPAVEQTIEENTFPMEYHFSIQNYNESRINEVEFDYWIKIESSVDNFPIHYQLIDEDKQEEIILTNGRSENFKMTRNVKQSQRLKLVLQWREINGDLADALQIHLKIETAQEDNQPIQEEIVALTRDNQQPICKVSYSTVEMTNQNVIVTINCNKEVEQASGFELSEDKKILTKEVSENEDETVTIRDLAGNSTQIEYHVNNIDKQPPTIIGCESGGIYTSPLDLEYYDNDEIKEVEIDQYSDKLSIIAYKTDKDDSELLILVEEHPLNTKKYRYYVDNKLYATVTDSTYVFTSLNKKIENEIKVEALDEFGNVLDTAIVEEIQDEGKQENETFSKEQLTKKGNYQIKVRDLAGNESIYDIKIK